EINSVKSLFFDINLFFCSSSKAAIPRTPNISFPNLTGVHISANSLHCCLWQHLSHSLFISLFIK
ncbi:MAG: hypothetical protein E7E21_06965, partial [Peptostreptococcaceae bacterium]|nr:hypothetical protein [Peptostreptococcaceae bacterium]